VRGLPPLFLSRSLVCFFLLPIAALYWSRRPVAGFPKIPLRGARQND
jgi:hypothetical protein